MMPSDGTITKVFHYDPATTPMTKVRVYALKQPQDDPSDVSWGWVELDEPDLDVDVVPGWRAWSINDDGEGTLVVEYEPDDEGVA